MPPKATIRITRTVTANVEESNWIWFDFPDNATQEEIRAAAEAALAAFDEPDETWDPDDKPYKIIHPDAPSLTDIYWARSEDGEIHPDNYYPMPPAVAPTRTQFESTEQKPRKTARVRFTIWDHTAHEVEYEVNEQECRGNFPNYVALQKQNAGAGIDRGLQVTRTDVQLGHYKIFTHGAWHSREHNIPIFEPKHERVYKCAFRVHDTKETFIMVLNPQHYPYLGMFEILEIAFACHKANVPFDINVNNLPCMYQAQELWSYNYDQETWVKQ